MYVLSTSRAGRSLLKFLWVPLCSLYSRFDYWYTLIYTFLTVAFKLTDEEAAASKN